jgi:hypothetical protein
MKPEAIWLPADAEPSVRVRRTIASEKRTLIVVWGIHGIVQYCWLPENSTLDLPIFCEEVFTPLAHKMQPNSKKARTPLTLIHMDNARVHMAREAQEKLDVSRFKRTPQPPESSEIALSDFFFSIG